MGIVDINQILFLDLEPFNSDKHKKSIRETGIVLDDLQLKSDSVKVLANRVKSYQPIYLCGHNLRSFDYHYLLNSSLAPLVTNLEIIDTLELSLLFFSENTLHKLPKSYKDNDPNKTNDPLQDALITKELLNRIIERFYQLSPSLQQIYFSLLYQSNQFKPFFELLNLDISPLSDSTSLTEVIFKELEDRIQTPDKLTELVSEQPIEMAYIISVLHGDIEEIRSFPPKIHFDYPNIQEKLNNLTFNQQTEINTLEHSSLKYFGFDSFRSFPRFKADNDLIEALNSEVSQKEIIGAALQQEDILAVLPTGGGKTFTFWLPAIIKAKRTRALTVVISPLQALMKDHIFNFNHKLAGLASAEALSGYLTMPERRNIISRVINGSIDILYLAPESLRSKNIERILSYRYIDRIVIDEAHCLSTWGNDFRHDYFYIAQFIKTIQDNKYTKHIPISCFTATANKKTIEEIETYFKSQLNISFEHYIASPKRTNLIYSAQCYGNKKAKTQQLIAQIRSIKDPCLVYNPSSRKQCEMLAEQLSMDLGRPFYSFHAGMSSAAKNQVLSDFISNDADGIVATTAFGMGIDKPDIRHVIHYEVSSSLEDYMQESGRAGRDGQESHCHILFNNEDFDKIFFSLIRQKVTHPEIKKIFQSIRRYKGRKVGDERKIVVSINELAESAGMKTDDEQSDFDTKVKTALLELERSNYIRRGYNVPEVWVTSFEFKSMEQLHQVLQKNGLSDQSENADEKALYQSIILLSQVLIKRSTERFSISIEELAEILNLNTDEVYRVLDKMRDLELVSLKEDLLISDIKPQKLRQLTNTLSALKKHLTSVLYELSHQRFKLKELNSALNKEGISILCADYSYFLKYLLLNLTKKGMFECYRDKVGDHAWYAKVHDSDYLNKAISQFVNIVQAVVQYIMNEGEEVIEDKDKKTLISYEKMMQHCNNHLNKKISVNVYDKAILFLHKIRLLRLEGGRVLHHMQIEVYVNNQLSSNKQYTQEDYKLRMAPLYQRKRSAVHIMEHYVQLLSRNSMLAGKFATDYFTLDFADFVKYYKLSKKLKLPISKERYDRIVGGLTDDQKAIVFDEKASTMLILAGPGTGKTKVLVNKIAHMIIEGDYKPEHFLMLTFTRSAAHEFKQRLFDLLSDLAYDIDIYTFHGYATELAGIGFDNNQKSQQGFDQLIPTVTEKLKNNELFLPFKNAVILDEFQDINEDAFKFVSELYRQFSEMKGQERASDVRMIAVGDDDQCIMEMTNGANINYMRKFVTSFKQEDDKRKWYKLGLNFRSKSKIVQCNNQFASEIRERIDEYKVISSHSKQTGDVFIHYYQTPDFLTALLPFIQKSNQKNIAILSHENEQVLDIYSILKEDSTLDISYLLKNEGFHLNMMDEITAFSHFIETNLNTDDKIISQTLFDNAKDFLIKEYAESSKLNIALKHIHEFEEKHDLLTLSFWNNYTWEVFAGSFNDTQTKIVVSTIHRSKGKEFDEVHVILQKEHHQKNPDYFKRLYYVALSRAKTSLHIHSYPRQSFKTLESLDIETKENSTTHFPPIKKRLLIMQLEDAFLSYLSKNKNNKQYVSKNKIISGSSVSLKIDNNGNGYSIIHNSTVIGRTSKKFTGNLKSSIAKGYMINHCEVEYIAKWFCKDTEQFNDIFLCKIELIKKTP